MGILDEAIREHLELKRQHGAGDSELKQLEDEAFGQAERPGDEAAQDPLAEAPTEFTPRPEETEQDSGRREPSIADLQEPPPPAPAEPEPEEEDSEGGPSTGEREAIAEQPTELFDVDESLGEAPSPTDEELVEEEVAEPRLSSADPLVELEEDEAAEVSIQGPAPDDDEEYEDEDDAFWNEQRLSDELDQALEAPRDPEPEPADEVEQEEDEEIEPEDPPVAETPRHDEDVLEETPDFLEETPEDDELWFEQKPPKDFDFDD
ncbi:MAG: hypothetical protein ACHQCI_07390 [Solirubrobacterales bacterium]|jgi:hypothetical protein